MAGAPYQVDGEFPAAGTSSTYAQTIAATKAGSFLFATCRFNTAGPTRTISSNGSGTWTTVYDATSFDGTNIVYFLCKDPGAGTTQVTYNNGGTNTHFTPTVIEIQGCDPNGTVWTPANHNDQTTVTAWTSSTITPTRRVFAIGCSHQASGGTPLSSGGTGWNAVAGAGITTGNNSNTAEGDCSFFEWGYFPPGPVIATGTWASAVSPASYVIGFELLPDAGSGAVDVISADEPITNTELYDVGAWFGPVPLLVERWFADELTVAGSASSPVGTATETDTALALSGVQLRATGLATETDTALTLAGVGIRATGVATETDAALALTPLQIKAAGLATETDAASALSGVQLRQVGRADETDTALALSSGSSGAVGLAEETDTAFALDGVVIGGGGASPTAGVPGRGHRHRYIAYINGQQYVGPLEYIETVVREYADQQAKKAVETEKKPKKARIVVQPGRKVDNAPAVTEEIALTVQKSVRDTYAEAYALALNRLRELEDDEDETLLMLI